MWIRILSSHVQLDISLVHCTAFYDRPRAEDECSINLLVLERKRQWFSIFFLNFSLVASSPFFVSFFFLKNASTVGWNFGIFSAVSQPYPDSSRSGLWKCRLLADSWKLPYLQFRVSSSDFCTRVARSASNSRTTWLNDFSNVFTFSWSYTYKDKVEKSTFQLKQRLSFHFSLIQLL